MTTLEILTFAILPLFLLLEVLTPGATGTPGWRLRAATVTAVTFALSLVAGAAYKAVFAGASLLPGDRLGTAGGALVGMLVYDFCHYWYHRCAHRFDALWRLGHQMHHSAESLDPWGAYFLHPLDAAFFLTLSNVVLYPVLGLTPAAGAAASALTTFCAVFQHARLATPRWLGWLVQRPESHAVHHERGLHAFNYANLPLWDLLFGTLRNPPAGEPRPALGFYDGASARITEMLMFRDVSRPRTAQDRLPSRNARSGGRLRPQEARRE
ncbi:sterol desaturase family protein [Ramlibacter monticola]|uniref:Sterol desaturase family protein n=1 Tax=Ramlibacter monticola TaxID=1926872 RepID=A0A936YYE1_9BURK|nr:sterol desaturase family protein [Ramlibacter monticola]MBL0390220.1 sterol desaturase family protein [Ramlibacter monticola]